MSKASKTFIAVALSVAIAMLLLVDVSDDNSRAAEPPAQKDAAKSVAKTAAKTPALKPVDDDMHHFMEYVFQPTYLQLKPSMATEPADKAGWKKIKSGSLILAESANLLLIRPPDQHADVWNELSVEVRQRGGQLYRAAAKKDYTSARQHYVGMIEKCNTCHQKFADGEHQLKP